MASLPRRIRFTPRPLQLPLAGLALVSLFQSSVKGQTTAEEPPAASSMAIAASGEPVGVDLLPHNVNITTTDADPTAINPSSTSTSHKNAAYYILVVVFPLFIAIVVLYFWQRRRRRRRNALARMHAQHPMVRETCNGDYSQPWGSDYAAPYRQREEGINEWGEAPPAYKIAAEQGNKSDSTTVRTTEVSDGETMEMNTLGAAESDAARPKTGTMLGLPSYEESYGSRRGSGLSRPPRSITPTQHPVSIRTALSHAETSSHERL